MVLQGCQTGPAVDVRIDFDRFRAAAPVEAQCPDQEERVAAAGAFLMEKQDARALQAATAVIAAPCSRENYAKALKIAGDVFTRRQEFGQAFYFYLEGLNHAGDAREIRVFTEAAQGAAVQLPADAIIAGADAAGAGETIPGIWVAAGAAKLDRQDTAGAQQLFKAVTERFAGTPEAEKAVALLERMHKAAAFNRDRIGVLLPLTGFYQAAGERALNGIRTAVDARNRDGGGSFRLLVLDTGSDPAGVAAAVRHLENSGAACIIGPMVTAGPAAEQAQALEIPMIALSQEAGITDVGAFVFRNFLTPEAQTEGLVSYVMEEAGYKRFAVFYPDDRYGHRFREAFLQAVDAQGGQVTVQAAYAPGQADFSFLILPLIRGYQKLDVYRNFVDLAPGETRERHRIYRAKINFDAVFIPDGPETAAQISQQLRFHDIRDVILLGTNIWKPKALDRAGGVLLPAVFPMDFDSDSLEETVQTFVADYEAAFGELPDYFAAAGFDTAVQVMEGLSDPKVTSRARLMQALKATGFDRSVTLEILGPDTAKTSHF